MESIETWFNTACTTRLRRSQPPGAGRVQEFRIRVDGDVDSQGPYIGSGDVTVSGKGDDRPAMRMGRGRTELSSNFFPDRQRTHVTCLCSPLTPANPGVSMWLWINYS